MTSEGAQYELSAAPNSHVAVSFREHFFKVPAAQRRENPSAYQPHLFSFGLYPSTLPDNGDHFKQLAANALLDNYAFTSLLNRITSDLFPEIQPLYVELRTSSNESTVVCRIALDGITIVASAIVSKQRGHDHKQWQPPLVYPIVHMVFEDALLLENQIPISVLDYALESVNLIPGNLNLTQGIPTLQDVLQWYCFYASPFPNFEGTELLLRPDTMTKPLLSIIYSFLTECDGSDASVAIVKENPLLHTASHLARYGVSFHPADSKGNFRGISFDKKTAELKIPTIRVGEGTVRFLHNLLAYEATTRYPFQSYVSSFALFMDYLIDSKEDVIILVEAGVLYNDLGSHEKLASMWNNLCKSVSCLATPSDYQIMKDLEKVTKSRPRRWRASLKEKYWEKQPWLLISAVAALILLVLTFLQTVYTMKGAHK